MALCILVPLFAGVKFVKFYTSRDIRGCIDTFVHSEGIGLAKCIGMQFENVPRELERLSSVLSSDDLEDPKKLTEKLQSFKRQNPNIAYATIYDTEGKFVASSLYGTEADLLSVKKPSADGEIKYGFEQLKDNSVVVFCGVLRDFTVGDGSKKFCLQLGLKWQQYEKYVQGLRPGAFPRAIYVISPSCVRHISQNSLPKGALEQRYTVALGLHLASRIHKIDDGLFNITIESVGFRICKNKVKMPEKMKGSELFVVTATDDGAVETLSQAIFTRMLSMFSFVVSLWVMFCIAAAVFYINATTRLAIANTITDSTPLATVVFRASDGKITKINLSATTMFRITKDDMDKVNVWDFFIEEHNQKYVSNAISSGINVLNYEMQLRSVDGAYFWSICSASPIDIGENQVLLAVLDINNRKEMEKKLANNAALLEKQVAERTADLEIKAKELENSNSLLESAKMTADQANDAKSKFLTSVSNELKTPLNAIIGYGEILYEEAMDRKDSVSSDDLQKIIGSAKHLLSLIDEIMDLSSIEAGKTQLFFQNIDIAGVIQDVEGIAMPLITEHDNSLLLEYSKNIGMMYTDVTKLRQCILNLLSNAAKFTEFGKVTMRITGIVENGVDYVEFSVIDTGIGIDPDRIGNIFLPFQKNDSEQSGAGLGLSVTKKYVELMGGTVAVESEFGAGSKFTIKIPRVCVVKSSEFLDVKNQSEDEVLEAVEVLEEDETTDDEILEAETPSQEDAEANSFARRSELSVDDDSV
ncbi:MAG: PAS domain-containing sensor histidine kinase [Holosporaceae bacterium]|nr:PAS domain-containing sensor histidine kinase [Holosporaceae bacterium]